MCDREDLFKIAYEADRVLAEGGTIVLLDFNTSIPYKNFFYETEKYSFKMDYGSMFLWNPAYTLLSFTSFSHKSNLFCREMDERLGIHILVKNNTQGWPIKNHD